MPLFLAIDFADTLSIGREFSSIKNISLYPWYIFYQDIPWGKICHSSPHKSDHCNKDSPLPVSDLNGVFLCTSTEGDTLGQVFHICHQNNQVYSLCKWHHCDYIYIYNHMYIHFHISHPIYDMHILLLLSAVSTHTSH